MEEFFSGFISEASVTSIISYSYYSSNYLLLFDTGYYYSISILFDDFFVTGLAKSIGIIISISWSFE